MRLSKPSKSTDAECDSSKALIGLIVCVGLIVYAIWKVSSESRELLRGLRGWAALLERARRLGKYLYLVTLLLLVIRAFKGIGAAFQLFLAIICLPIASLLQRVRGVPGHKGPEQHEETKAMRILGRAPHLPGIVLLLIEGRSREHLAGDLEEEYVTVIVPRRGHYYARCWWYGQILAILSIYLWGQAKRTAASRLGLRWRRR